MRSLDGKNVVITGGSYGIGFEIAREFLKEGANVFPLARNKEKLKTSIEDLRRNARLNRCVLGYSCDVGDNDAVNEVIEDVASEQGGIDVLINNAGIVLPGYFEDLSVDDFERVLRTNYLGALYSTKAALPHLLKQKESAVTFTSSAAGIKGLFGYSTYSPSKFALIGLAETLRQELKHKGVQVTVLCPSDTDTPGFKEEKSVRPLETGVLAGSGRLMSPAHVAKNFLSGFKNNKFIVITGFDGKLLYRINGISPRLTDFYLDSLVSGGRRKTSRDSRT